MASASDTTCPRCGAGIPVPETGLNMECEYCGHDMPVPDVEQRRKAMEREAAHRRELEAREQRERLRREREAEQRAQRARDKKQRKREAARQARRGRWRARLATIPGCLMALVIIGISLAAPAVGLFQAGLLDAFVGDDGSSAHASAQTAMLNGGYTVAAHPQLLRLLASDSDRPTVELRSDLCYAFAVGSGELITALSLEGPSGEAVVEKNERAYAHVLTHCPETSGIHQLEIGLDQEFGRYTWSWGWRAKVTAPAAPSRSTSPTRSGTRRSSRRR
jgi:uncharacterized Zn finger protein (UPF0148 family)